jgi:diguanylate cyclase (GGDEF)-like protein
MTVKERLHRCRAPVQRRRGDAWRWVPACAALLLLLLLGGLAQAQQRAFHYLRHEQGLENLVVTALVQDADGVLWIGTENGLYQFAGARMRRYGAEHGLADQTISYLHIDTNGLLWVSSQQTLYRREGAGFVAVDHAGRPVQPQPGQSLASTREGLVVNTRDGLLMLRREAAGWQGSVPFGKGRREFRTIYSVLAGPDGVVWFGCDNGLCRLDRTGLRLYGPAGRDATEPLTRLLRTPGGQLWLRSDRQLWRLDEGAEAPTRVDMPDAKHFVVTPAPALANDARGHILTQVGGGLGRWDGRRWELIGADQGLQAGGGVSTALEARDGSVWLGTAGSGLVQWLGYRYAQSWGRAEGLASEDAWAFLRTRDGSFYLGTMAGLSVQRGPGRMVRAASGQPEGVASSLAEDARGRVWVGSFDGQLSVFDPASRQQTLVARVPRVTRLITDRQGQLWVVTHDGIFVLPDPVRGGRLVRASEALVSAGTPVARANDACMAADGQVWITTDDGLLRGQGRQLERVGLRRVDGQPLATHELISIACSDAGLWLGGNSGLWRVAVDAGATELVVQHADVPLLRQRALVAMRMDRRGWLWVATDYGVAVSDLKRWRFIRHDAGLPWNDSNQGALYEDADGAMWIGTTRGAARLGDVDSLFDVPALSVTAEARGVRSAAGGGAARLTLPWEAHSLALELASTSYEQRGALRFEHRLQGQDEDWRSGSSTELVYPSLQPGLYRFEVRARNLDMQAESPLQSLDIEVLPPWWRTGWFHGTVAAAVLALAWLAYRWRMRRYRLRQQVLERLVAERTREIEASHAQMRELALKDGLTGVLNRRALNDAVAAEIARAGRSRLPLALVMVDADHFKRINDEHGHPAGDAVLVAIAQRLQATTRPYDAIGRYGGEEFLLLLPELDVRSTEGRARIEAFHRAICSRPVALAEGTELAVTCSFGVAGFMGGSVVGPEALITSADAALYRAKENGRNRIEYAPLGVPQ